MKKFRKTRLYAKIFFNEFEEFLYIVSMCVVFGLSFLATEDLFLSLVILSTYIFGGAIAYAIIDTAKITIQRIRFVNRRYKKELEKDDEK